MTQQINPETQRAIRNLIISAEELAERAYNDKALKAKRGYDPKSNREDFELTVKQDIAALREKLGVVAILTEPHPAPGAPTHNEVGPELTLQEQINQLNSEIEAMGRRLILLEAK
jgi:hypothetical protein